MDGCAKFISNDAYQHYLNWPRKWRDSEKASGVFHHPISAREELAAFVFMRSSVLSANVMFDEAYRTCEVACRLSPEHPGYRDELEVIDVNRRNRELRSMRFVAPLQPQPRTYTVPFDPQQRSI